MAENRVGLDIIVDVDVMNAEQLRNAEQLIKDLGLTSDQVSQHMKDVMERSKQAMQAAQQTGEAASRASTGINQLAGAHNTARQAAISHTRSMGDFQNALSNAMVNASMAGNAFSNLAWGIMFSPTSTAVAFTVAATAVYAFVATLVAAEQQTQALTDRTLALSAVNNISIQEAQAYAPALDALGIKTNDLVKAREQAVQVTGRANALEALAAEAAARGAVMTDQETAALMKQQEAVANLSLSWQAFQIQIGAALAPIATNAIEGYSQIIQGATQAGNAQNFLQGTGQILHRAFVDLLPPVSLYGMALEHLRGQHDTAAIAAANHRTQEAALEKQMGDTLTAVNKASDGTLSARQADIQAAQAILQLGQAGQIQEQSQRAIQESTDKVKVAQDAYTDAVRKFGPASDQALKAHTALMAAQDGLAKATNAAKDDALQQQAAEVQAEAAVRSAAKAAADAKEQQAELGKAHLTAAQYAQEQIDELGKIEVTVIPGSPLWNAIERWKAELASIQTNVTTTISAHIVTQSPSVGNPVEGFTSAEGAVFTQPTLTWIGDNGPEAAVPLRPGHSAPGASPLSALGGGPIVLEHTTHLIVGGELMQTFIERVVDDRISEQMNSV